MFRESLLFQKFVLPFALRILFWAGIAGTLYGSSWLFVHDNWAWTLALVFGTLLTRLVLKVSYCVTRPIRALQKFATG